MEQEKFDKLLAILEKQQEQISRLTDVQAGNFERSKAPTPTPTPTPAPANPRKSAYQSFKHRTQEQEQAYQKRIKEVDNRKDWLENRLNSLTTEINNTPEISAGIRNFQREILMFEHERLSKELNGIDQKYLGAELDPSDLEEVLS